MDEETLPRRQPGQRERGTLDLAQPGRLRSEELCRHDRVLGGDAVPIEGRQGEHVVADAEATDIAGDLLHDTGELVRHDRRQAVGGPVELVSGDGRRVHAYKGFTGTGLRNLDLVNGQRIDAARRMHARGSHHRLEPTSEVNTVGA